MNEDTGTYTHDHRISTVHNIILVNKHYTEDLECSHFEITIKHTKIVKTSFMLIKDFTHTLSLWLLYIFILFKCSHLTTSKSWHEVVY